MTFFFTLHPRERNLIVFGLLGILLLRLLLLLGVCFALILGLILLRWLLLLYLLLALVGCLRSFLGCLITWGRLAGDGLRPKHRLKHVLVRGKVVV